MLMLLILNISEVWKWTEKEIKCRNNDSIVDDEMRVKHDQFSDSDKNGNILFATMLSSVNYGSKVI